MIPRLILLFVLSVPLLVHAQGRESALSENEVEKLRATAYDAPERMLVFVGFLDDRTKLIDRTNAGRRHAGREEDTHDLMEQFTSVADDLDDNLDDWATRHMDVRKTIPKLLAATERWETALKSPPDNEAYNVSRKLALESIADVRENARKVLEAEKVYFLAHPPTPNAEKGAPR